MSEEKHTMDEDLASSIEMLEQILEVMPHDIAALKSLYNAYFQCNYREKAFEYLSTIVTIVDEGNDAETAKFVVDQLSHFEEEFPAETATWSERFSTMIESEGPVSTVEGNTDSAPAAETDISEELALAWKLYEENQLSQEEYSSVLHDLTEVSSREVDVPVSVLHVLNDRGFNQMNRIMSHMSSRSGVPCISLLNFELPEEVSEILPLDVSVSDGALPFGFFGNDLLVAVLNPFNNLLVDKVERVGGHRCHTYLVSAEEYDVALGRLRAMAA